VPDEQGILGAVDDLQRRVRRERNQPLIRETSLARAIGITANIGVPATVYLSGVSGGHFSGE
jgi:hypothetical protein